jgi:ADP-heptose:LPS heptosyltransferase
MPSELADFYRMTQSARKVIVVDLGFLGDSVHLIPALWEIKRHYPEAALHTLSAPVGAEVLTLAPCVDKAWAFPLGSPSPRWWRHWKLIRALRGERCELAFNFSGADRTLFLTALTGARWRVAHEAGRRHFWNPWLIRHWIPRQNRELPVFEQRREALAACGFALAPARFDLSVPPDARAWATANVPHGAVHLSVNASTFLKEWPLPHWIGLTQRLFERHPVRPVVATGSAAAREQSRLRALSDAVRSQGLRTFSGLSIARLAALLERCSLHVGADSGVLHLALALGVPTLALFRDYPGLEEWVPRGGRHRHLKTPCACVTTPRAACLDPETSQCLAGLAPATVSELIEAEWPGEPARA